VASTSSGEGAAVDELRFGPAGENSGTTPSLLRRNTMDDSIRAALILVLVMFYFTPSAVAAHRAHKNFKAIIALNVLLGWTTLGWIGALVWALTANTERR
jgi:hypothetical protein